VLGRLGALAVTVYACGLAGIPLLAAAVVSSAGGSPILRIPTATELAALIPVTSLAAVALTGTSTITPFRFLAALVVLAGVILGLGRAPGLPQAP
jgi:hypothetical protein